MKNTLINQLLGAIETLHPKPRVCNSRDDIFNDEPSLTKQEFREETDINNLMDRLQKGYEINTVPLQPAFFDTTIVPKFDEAQDIIVSAYESFESLPAKIRDRFDGDISKFVGFISDPENKVEAIRLGLLEPDQQASTGPQVAGVEAQTVEKKD